MTKQMPLFAMVLLIGIFSQSGFAQQVAITPSELQKALSTPLPSPCNVKLDYNSASNTLAITLSDGKNTANALIGTRPPTYKFLAEMNDNTEANIYSYLKTAGQDRTSLQLVTSADLLHIQSVAIIQSVKNGPAWITKASVSCGE